MIARIAGRLDEIATGRALVDTHAGLWYEVRICAYDTGRLSRKVGQDVMLYTIHYFEGDPTRGQQEPALIGFLNETDRDFFRVFTTVKGVGIRKALRALVNPPAEVAAAIQAKDVKQLQTLPEIGKRMAERIITELHGKLDEFAGPATSGPTGEALSEAGEEAISVLVQLGEKRIDAAALVERVLAVDPEMDSPEEIIKQAYRLKAGAAKG
ncbi:MAG: Holliday junction branch migration protein RuvA [Phycisphaerae bacterium]